MRKKILIVTANYYKEISLGLLNSAKKNLPRNFNIKIIKVPGVFEIPVTISKHIKNLMLLLLLDVLLKVKLHILISYLNPQLMLLWIYLLIQKNL